VLVSGPLRTPVDTIQGPRHDEAGPGTQETDVKRILSAAAAAALSICLLTACGGDGSGKAGSGGDYCSDLKDAKKEVDALKDGDFSDLEKTTDAMNELADEAPDEIKDDWEILVKGVTKLVDALKKAGLDDDDMATLQTGEIPDGVDITVLQSLMTEIKALDTPEFQEAGENINKHAKDECGVDLQA
jgi:hypothetical protein